MPLVDLLKAVGAQFIVLHHLAFYGPMTDYLTPLLPAVMAWLSQDARMAVQVFLVVAGFLAARSLAPQMQLRPRYPLRALVRRYRRVALPYLAALLVAVLCAELARRWMVHDSIPAPVQWGQWLAHVALLHSVLDVESLSAGVWYVAIDFQLYASLLLVLWFARASQARAAAVVVLVAVGVVASLFVFNVDADWDIWALYFFAAYGMGVLAYWMAPLRDRPMGWLALGVLWGITALALYVEPRARIALAVCVASVLALASHYQGQPGRARARLRRVVARLSDLSYAVFLLNFPVALVVNAAFERFVPHQPLWQGVGVVLAWLACNAAAALFHDHVEQRLQATDTRRMPQDSRLSAGT